MARGLAPTLTWILWRTLRLLSRIQFSLVRRDVQNPHLCIRQDAVRVHSRRRISSNPSGHKLDHCGLDEGEACGREALEILRHTAVYADPSKRSFDDPSLRQHLETELIAFDDFRRSRAGLFDRRTLMAAIAADFLDERKAAREFVENESCSVAILNAR